LQLPNFAIDAYYIFHQHVQADQKLEADKAIEYFRILNATKSLQYYDKRLVQELDVLIAVITVARAKSSYLKQTVASIDNQIKAGEAANMAVIVCDASSETAVYPEAVELSSYLPVLKIYGKNLMVEPNWKQVRYSFSFIHAKLFYSVKKLFDLFAYLGSKRSWTMFGVYKKSQKNIRRPKYS
jgi:hypothetical protein